MLCRKAWCISASITKVFKHDQERYYCSGGCYSHAGAIDGFDELLLYFFSTSSSSSSSSSSSIATSSTVQRSSFTSKSFEKILRAARRPLLFCSLAPLCLLRTD